MRRLGQWLLVAGAVWWAPLAKAQYSSTQMTVLPYVQPSGLIDLGLNASWTFQTPSYGASRAGINTQFQTYSGVPMNVGGYSTYVRSFNNQSVPFLGRAPFIGGIFRNRSQFQHRSMGNFTVRATPVDPAGNPMYRTGYPYRLPAPRMIGIVPAAPPKR